MASHSLRFTTVRIGVVAVDVAGQRIETDVRVLLGGDGAFRLLAGGALSEPLPSIEATVARAGASEPSDPGVIVKVQWRNSTAPLGDERACPICGAPAFASSRYPRPLCPACVLEATDAAGRSLRFDNVSLSGGLAARFADDGSLYEGDKCFVRGVRCRAEERRFGGVVLQPDNR